MSEILNPQVAAANLSAQGLELAEFNGQLCQEAVTLSADSSIYPPEQIGLAATLQSGHQTSIVGEISLPATPDRTLQAVVIKFSGVDGAPGSYGLGGIGVDEHGVPRLNGQFVQLHRGTTLQLGRQPQPREDAVGMKDISLWPEGQGYGDLTSRSHLSLSVTEYGVEVVDTSANGTRIRGQVGPTVETALVEKEPSSQALEVIPEQSVPSEAVEEPMPKTIETVLEPMAEAVESEPPMVEEINEEFGTLHQNQALRELQEQWGLPEGATVELAMSRLDATLESLQRIQGLLGAGSDLVTSRLPDLKRRFYNSLSAGVVSFGPNHIQSVAEELAKVVQNTQALLQDSNAVLPRRDRQNLDNSLHNLRSTVGAIEGSMHQPGRMETDAVNTAWQLINRGSVEQVSEITVRLMREIDEKRQALIGYAAASESGKSQKEFTDDRIEVLARNLRAEGATDTAIHSAVVAVERYITDAIEDRVSGFTFPERIVGNTEKARSYGQQNGKTASSRQIASEMAVDMLLNRFDFEHTPDPITLRQDGNVKDGQHRAAALMALYGKDWAERGIQAGHKIVIEHR